MDCSTWIILSFSNKIYSMRNYMLLIMSLIIFLLDIIEIVYICHHTLITQILDYVSILG